MIDTDCSWWYTNRQNWFTVVCILIEYIILYGIFLHVYHYIRRSFLTDPFKPSKLIYSSVHIDRLYHFIRDHFSRIPLYTYTSFNGPVPKPCRQNEFSIHFHFYSRSKHSTQNCSHIHSPFAGVSGLCLSLSRQVGYVLPQSSCYGIDNALVMS